MTTTYLTDDLVLDAGLDPASWTEADTKAAVWEPSYQDGCADLQVALDVAYDDPMSEYVDGLGDMVTDAHVRRHGCRGLRAVLA